MAVQKQAIPISFSGGLDTKTDPFQVQSGKFLVLDNSTFAEGGNLTKRNGFGELSTLPVIDTAYLTTFSGNLTAIGSTLQAYSAGSATWVQKGNLQPLDLEVLPVVRSALSQTQTDSCVSDNGLVCTVFTEVNNGTASYKYSVQDSVTGQSVVSPTLIPNGSGVVTGSPRVFLLNGYFIVVFTNLITATSHLQYIAISAANPSVASTPADIVSSYIPATSLSWDGVVVGTKLYIAYNSLTGGQKVAITYLSSNFLLGTPQTFAASKATAMSMTADMTNPASPVIYAAFYDSTSTSGFAVAVDQNLNQRMTATQIITGEVVTAITASAQNGVLTSAYEVSNTYSYNSVRTDLLKKVSVTLPNTVTTGTVSGSAIFSREVGVASKSFLMNGTQYVLTVQQSSLQNTYFLMDLSGQVIGKLAYENAGGYLTAGLPQAQVNGSAVFISYLYKDLIQVSVDQGDLQSIGPAGSKNIYSQTGINLATYTFSAENLTSSEIGGNLNLTGGIVWQYDGLTLNELGMLLFPENITATWSTTGGSVVAQPDAATNTNAYWYQVTYEWTDNRGNIVRSAPSIPVSVTTTGTGTTGSIVLNIPTLRLTYKTGVKIVIYRWSVANQVYYQVSSITNPTLNDKTVDQVTYTDTAADVSIVGNNIIYTTGGVLENIAPPAARAMALFDNRLWLISAEDPNLLYYSRQIIENVPVETSDLLTFYVAPSTGAQGSTGPMWAISPMDDKLIIFKEDAIYYINGSGPDNTGNNGQYSQPIFVASTVGTKNQKSIALQPKGLMFRSPVKGTWLLDRSLQTQYIGADVEKYNDVRVNSAVNIPNDYQVRFPLDNGIMLVYDYFYEQWGTYSGATAVASTLYEGKHSIVSSTGLVSQETPDKYLDNGNPVLMKFKTAWFNLAGLQGYQRAFFFYLLGKYFSPHKMFMELSYDYNESPAHSVLITPNNFSPNYGSSDAGGNLSYGQQSPFGGPGDVINWRVFLKQQRCQAFQITFTEIYDPSLGQPAGQGLTLSGINLVVALKRGYSPISAKNSAGAS